MTRVLLVDDHALVRMGFRMLLADAKIPAGLFRCEERRHRGDDRVLVKLAHLIPQADEMGTIASMAAAKREWARTLGAHERAHVKIIKQVLGSKAEGRPSFDFGKANETDAAFTRTAVAMEDLTVALLAGVTPKVRDKGLVAALFGLLTVEARHAAWARHIVGSTPAPRAFDEPMTLSQVQGAIARTRFVVTRPRVSGTRSPRFTG